jgi:hypothetical protein
MSNRKLTALFIKHTELVLGERNCELLPTVLQLTSDIYEKSIKGAECKLPQITLTPLANQVHLLNIGDAEFKLSIRPAIQPHQFGLSELSQSCFSMALPDPPPGGFTRPELDALTVVYAQIFRLALFDNGGQEVNTASALLNFYPLTWMEELVRKRGPKQRFAANVGLLRALWLQHVTKSSKVAGQAVVWEDFKCVSAELGLGDNPFAWTPVEKKRA